MAGSELNVHVFVHQHHEQFGALPRGHLVLLVLQCKRSYTNTKEDTTHQRNDAWWGQRCSTQPHSARVLEEPHSAANAHAQVDVCCTALCTC